MQVRIAVLAGLVLAALVAPLPTMAAATPAAAAPTPKFLTLPFTSVRHMHVQQAWDFASGQHQAIDYIKGTLDATSTWRGFPVVAAADGRACGEMLGHNGCVVRPGIMGNRVMIRHKVNGVVFFTFYNHLQWIASSIPLGDKHNRVTVKRGQVIGYAGSSGDTPDLIHLHFQLLDAHMQPVDPYGIYGNRAQYPDPRGTNGKRSRKRNYWTTNPPTLSQAPGAAAAGSIVITHVDNTRYRQAHPAARLTFPMVDTLTPVPPGVG